MSSLTILEIIWTLFAGFGVVVSIYNVIDVLTDMRILTRSKLNGIRSLVVKGSLRNESVRLFVLVVFLVIGVLALSNPALGNDTEDTSAFVRWTLRLGLILVNIAVVYNTYADRILRRRIFRFADKAEGKRLDKGRRVSPPNDRTSDQAREEDK